MHTLGFTSKHDAAFLSALTRAGTSQVSLDVGSRELQLKIIVNVLCPSTLLLWICNPVSTQFIHC